MDDEATQEMLLKTVRKIDALPPSSIAAGDGAHAPGCAELSAPVLEEHSFTKEQFMAF